jgi:hypothetical protein
MLCEYNTTLARVTATAGEQVVLGSPCVCFFLTDLLASNQTFAEYRFGSGWGFIFG